MLEIRLPEIGKLALVALLTGATLVCPALAAIDTAAHAAATGVPAAPAIGQKKVSPYQPVKLTAAAQNYYMAAWGIDKLKVSYTASGNLIRFSYRVADPNLAKPLGDEKAMPSLRSASVTSARCWVNCENTKARWPPAPRSRTSSRSR